LDASVLFGTFFGPLVSHLFGSSADELWIRPWDTLGVFPWGLRDFCGETIDFSSPHEAAHPTNFGAATVIVIDSDAHNIFLVA